MLTVGNAAPVFELTALNGQRYALDAKLTLAIFFKTTCPTCQYAWPFYERLFQAYRHEGLDVVGVSQHDSERTRQFGQEYGSTFTLLIDADWQVSRKYDPEFVPTLFLLSPQREIIGVYPSWNSQQLNELSQLIARHLRTRPQVVVKPEDQAVPFKPG